MRFLLIILGLARVAAADPDGSGSDSTPSEEHATTPLRVPDATFAHMFHGPFQSSRLFAMPTADTVGAYVLSLSGDGSLLQQPGVLTSAGVIAAGFGDIAQLEYRHTEAISVTGVNAPVPAIGAQLKLPIPEHSGVPALGVAYRLGVMRRETFGATNVDETVTDLFIVMRERLASVPWLTLHAGIRISPSKIAVTGDAPVSKTLDLPTAGIELAMNPTAKLVAEVAYAPAFQWMPGAASASIGYGVLGRLGVRWSILPSAILDASFGYQLDSNADDAAGDPRDIVQQWDIRLGAEIFVPWGALTCRAIGAFCD